MDSHKTRTTWTQDEAWKMYQMLTHLVSHKDALDAHASTRSKRALERALSSVDDLLHELYEATPAITTPDTPTAGVTGSGGRYIPKRHETRQFRYCVWDTETETALQIASERFIWTTLPRVKRECARLNASKRYVVKTDPPGAMFTFRKIVDTETNTEIEGMYLSPEAAERECSRLNGESS